MPKMIPAIPASQARDDGPDAQYSNPFPPAVPLKSSRDPHPCPKCGMIVPDARGLMPCWHRDCPE